MSERHHHLAVNRTAVGMCSMGLKEGSSHCPPRMPIMHTTPPERAHCNEASSVVVPISSRTRSTSEVRHHSLVASSVAAGGHELVDRQPTDSQAPPAEP